MTQIVTGCTILKRHRSLMKVERSPQCKCGGDEETAIHVLTECPLHARNRWQYLGRATLKQEEIHEMHIDKVLKFAKASKKWSQDI